LATVKLADIDYIWTFCKYIFHCDCNLCIARRHVVQ